MSLSRLGISVGQSVFSRKPYRKTAAAWSAEMSEARTGHGVNQFSGLPGGHLAGRLPSMLGNQDPEFLAGRLFLQASEDVTAPTALVVVFEEALEGTAGQFVLRRLEIVFSSQVELEIF